MTWSRLMRPDVPFHERVPWLLMLATAVVVLGLTVLSAVNYATVTQAHVNTSLLLAYAVRYVNVDSRGVLNETGGAIRFWVNLTVDNPTSRTLDFQDFIIKAWLGGAPTPTGYYLVFLPTFNVNTLPVPPPPVGPGSQGTLRLEFSLSSALNPSVFENVTRIQNETANAGGSPLALPWDVYALVTLTIEGVPDPIIGSAEYQLNVNRVILQEGTDLGS